MFHNFCSQFWKWLREMGGGEDTNEDLEETGNEVKRKVVSPEEWEAQGKVVGLQERGNEVDEEGVNEVDGEEADKGYGDNREAGLSDDDDDDDFHDLMTFHEHPRDLDSVAVRVYELLESPQPHLCRSSRVLGGVYSWKKVGGWVGGWSVGCYLIYRRVLIIVMSIILIWRFFKYMIMNFT